MRRPAGWRVLAALVGAALGAAPAHAKNQDAEGTVRKSEEGLHFQVPEDWPVERRDGIVRPIPMEEYLGKKFKALEASIQGLEQHVSGLDLKVRVLEDEVKKAKQGLRSTETAGAP